MLGAGWRNAKLCSEKPPHGLITVRSRNFFLPGRPELRQHRTLQYLSATDRDEHYLPEPELRDGAQIDMLVLEREFDSLR